MRSNQVSRRAFVVGAAVAAAAALTATRSAGSAPAGPSSPRDSSGMITARQRFFGAENVDVGTGAVDPSKAILSWFGVSNFAMAIGGNIVLLDAWVPRGGFSNYVPTSPGELATLAPSHILIGHGDFDHAADAADIATQCGATVVGTTEHCQQITQQAGRELRTHSLDGDRVDFSLPGGVAVRAVRHLHSALRPPTGAQPPLVLAPDFTPSLEHPPTRQDIEHLAAHLGDEQGGSLLYQFQLGDFVLTWHDTSGPIASDAPDALERLRALPASTVQIGAIQGFGQYTNGLSDPLDYLQALRPEIFVPGHHDNWLAPLSAPATAYEPRLRQALAGLPNPPELRMITDPADYVRPAALTFDIAPR